MNTCAATLSHLLARGKGSITLIGSIAGIQGVPFAAPYVAAKHGVTELAKTLSNELSDDGIRVNAVRPGVVQTTMLDSRLTKVVEDHMAEDLPHAGGLHTVAGGAGPRTGGRYQRGALPDLGRIQAVTGVDLSVDAGLNAL